MSEDQDDGSEWDDWWDDWSDENEPTPYEDPDGQSDGVPILTAVFEDGPPSKPFACLADNGLNQWPPTWEWVAHDGDGALIQYIYRHTGNGHYRVALTRRLDV